jgi:hypothetical protein
LRALNIPLNAWAAEQLDIERIGELFTRKFPQLSGFKPEDLLGTALFRVTPKVISAIDYTKGFGHSGLIELG